MCGRFRDLERRALVAIRGGRKYHYPPIAKPMVPASEVQELVRAKLLDSDPCMIARYGSVELQAVVDFLYPTGFQNAIDYVRGKSPSWGYAPSTIHTMYLNAGFFPARERMLDRFAELMVELAPMVDILGSWRKEEAEVMAYMPNVIRVPLFALEPYYFDQPWTSALEGKKVLVIHPFEDSILKQHSQYKELFSNTLLTPTYVLQTLKAVQSIAGNKPDRFDDWFQALEWMEQEISKRDFDIAIIGCGAYGFPLAAYVKSIGKKAIHLGGAVQYLFGIRSSAADRNQRLKPLINDSWIYPSEAERPENHQVVENSRYW